MGNIEKYKLISLYKSMIELDNKIISNISTHKSWILEFLSVDEIATILLLANNDIDSIKDKITIVGNELNDDMDELNRYGVYT